jgi:hypothetical protein
MIMGISLPSGAVIGIGIIARLCILGATVISYSKTLKII